MGDFSLDYSQVNSVVNPSKMPLRGNEYRIERVAFDLFKVDDDKESLWQVQADDDGNEFLVRTYDLPNKEASLKSNWNVIEDSKKENLTITYSGIPIRRVVASECGACSPSDTRLLREMLQERLTDPEFASKMLSSLSELKRAALFSLFPKLAEILPKIPKPAGDDPLEGIDPNGCGKRI